ncbi:MAG: cytochrome c [Actinobacteria bacterium]|nr:cytochrome c [Actinomycetota bacterium]
MPRRAALLACAGAVALLPGCGGRIEVPVQDAALHRGAVLFNERCSGCHTLAAANARGSKPAGQTKPGERTDGPNFNVRKESVPDVLFAIRNGGFSGSIMPANVVVGKDAREVAMFVARYAGRHRPGSGQSSGGQGPSSRSGGP